MIFDENIWLIMVIFTLNMGLLYRNLNVFYPIWLVFQGYFIDPKFSFFPLLSFLLPFASG